MKLAIRQINRIKRRQNEQRRIEEESNPCRTWVAKIGRRAYTGHNISKLK